MSEKMETKKRYIQEMRQKNKNVVRSVSAQHEHMELLIESMNDQHETLIEILEVLKEIATPNPLDKMKMTDEQLPTIEKEDVSLWGRWFKSKKAIPI